MESQWYWAEIIQSTPQAELSAPWYPMFDVIHSPNNKCAAAWRSSQEMLRSSLKKPESNATLPACCTHPFFILIPVSHCWISEVATPVLKHLASSAGSKQVTSFELTILLAEVS